MNKIMLSEWFNLRIFEQWGSLQICHGFTLSNVTAVKDTWSCLIEYCHKSGTTDCFSAYNPPPQGVIYNLLEPVFTDFTFGFQNKYHPQWPILSKFMIAKWNQDHMMALCTLNVKVPCLCQHLRYLDGIKLFPCDNIVFKNIGQGPFHQHKRFFYFLFLLLWQLLNVEWMTG